MESKQDMTWILSRQDRAYVMARHTCRHCHGRGILEFSHNQNDSNPLRWKNSQYCYCVKNRANRVRDIPLAFTITKTNP